MDKLKRFVEDEEGQTMVEYALLGALVAIVIAIALPTLTDAVANTFNDIAGRMPAAG